MTKELAEVIKNDAKIMAEKVKKVGIKREAGYLYFVDKQGDISRAKMARGGQKRKKKKAVKKKKAAKKKKR